jgi:hypothetical protein
MASREAVCDVHVIVRAKIKVRGGRLCSASSAFPAEVAPIIVLTAALGRPEQSKPS